MNFRAYSPVFVLFLISTSAFCQGSLLKEGQHGFSILGSYASTAELNSFQGTIIGTYAGTVDVGLFAGTTERKSISSNVGSHGGFIEIYVFRKSDRQKTPIEFSIFGQVAVVSGESFYSAGGTIFGRTDDTRKAFIQPFVTAGATLPKNQTDSEFSLELGVSIALKFGPANVFHVTPFIGEMGDGIGFGVASGFAFGKPDSRANKKIPGSDGQDF